MQQGSDAPSFNRTTAWELTLLALCAWREARDQGYDGMLAVCWSVRNRVNRQSWFGKTWTEVIEHKWQYSSFNPDDPNSHLLPGDPATDMVWADALKAAERAYLGLGVDPTLSSTHYYNPDVIKVPPAWVSATGTLFKLRIGAHLFYVAS